MSLFSDIKRINLYYLTHISTNFDTNKAFYTSFSTFFYNTYYICVEQIDEPQYVCVG